MMMAKMSISWFPVVRRHQVGKREKEKYKKLSIPILATCVHIAQSATESLLEGTSNYHPTRTHPYSQKSEMISKDMPRRG